MILVQGNASRDQDDSSGTLKGLQEMILGLVKSIYMPVQRGFRKPRKVLLCTKGNLPNRYSFQIVCIEDTSRDCGGI